jgi:hypothetical protein
MTVEYYGAPIQEESAIRSVILSAVDALVSEFVQSSDLKTSFKTFLSTLVLSLGYLKFLIWLRAEKICLLEAFDLQVSRLL